MKKTAGVFFLMVFSASVIFGASSRDNRGDSIIFIGYTPVGLHIPTLLTQPLSLGIILGESVEIGVETGSWEESDNDGDVTFSGEFSNTGMFLRWFPGNSFYFSLSGHKREWSLTATTTLSTGTVALASVETKATVVGLGIGNQWMFDIGLYIGVEWVMLSTAISSSKTVNISSSLTASEQAEAQQDFEDAGDTLNKWSGLSGLTILTVGWAI